jgi:hypothetical protein
MWTELLWLRIISSGGLFMLGSGRLSFRISRYVETFARLGEPIKIATSISSFFDNGHY